MTVHSINLGVIANTLVLGNDDYIVTGGDGHNILTLGNGNDQLNLGNGNNTLTLGSGEDQIALGNGNNTVTLGSGADLITAGDGNNTVTAVGVEADKVTLYQRPVGLTRRGFPFGPNSDSRF